MFKDTKLSFLKRMCDLVVKILLKVDDCDHMMTILLDFSSKVTTES